MACVLGDRYGSDAGFPQSRQQVSTDADLFDPAVLENPWPIYGQLRALSPVVFVQRYGFYALTRYDTVQKALKNASLFKNGDGVAFNEAMNSSQKLTILGSDAPDHTVLRGVLMPLLTSRALEKHHERAANTASGLVNALVNEQRFDAVTRLAQQLPMTIGLDILGLPQIGRRRHILCADMNFNAFGPLTDAILADLQRLEIYISKMADFAEDLAPDSIGGGIMAAARAGQITQNQALGLLQSVILGSLDTTARSLTTAIYYFAEHPDSWQMIREDPSLIPNAYNEILRLDGPTLAISRTLAADTEIEGYHIPAHARVALLFAAANRDERRWSDPDLFDIKRGDARDQLTFGYGIHFCVGHVLARMQAHALLTAMAAQISTITLVGSPRRRLSSVVRGFEFLPVQFIGSK